MAQYCSAVPLVGTVMSRQYGNSPDSKFHGANMGATWGRQDPEGPHVGLVNLALWEYLETSNHNSDHNKFSCWDF